MGDRLAQRRFELGAAETGGLLEEVVAHPRPATDATRTTC